MGKVKVTVNQANISEYSLKNLTFFKHFPSYNSCGSTYNPKM